MRLTGMYCLYMFTVLVVDFTDLLSLNDRLSHESPGTRMTKKTSRHSVEQLN